MKKEINIKEMKNINVEGGPHNALIKIEGTTDFLPMSKAMELMKSGNAKIVYESKKIETILDEQEKKYLKEVIRPFRDRIDSISKTSMPFSDNCFIAISLDNGDDEIFLPIFEKDEMYIGMEVDKQYSLEELGL